MSNSNNCLLNMQKNAIKRFPGLNRTNYTKIESVDAPTTKFWYSYIKIECQFPTRQYPLLQTLSSYFHFPQEALNQMSLISQT